MSIFVLYLLFVVMPGLRNIACSDALWVMLVLIFITSLISVTIAGVAKEIDDAKENVPIYKASRSIFNTTSILIGLMLLLSIVTPTEKQMYTIAGAYAVTNDAELKKLPDNVLKAANGYLERLNKSLTEEPKK